MLRGIRAISLDVTQLARDGPLGYLITLDPGAIRFSPTFKNASTEAHFSKLLVFASTNADMDQHQDMDDVESYAAAASSLRASFLKVEAISQGESRTPPIWQWAVRLPVSFVSRLGELHSVPLILMAHWCVLLHEVQHYWWTRGWVDQTMSEIRSSLLQEHQDWLDWPVQKIRDLREQQV